MDRQGRYWLGSGLLNGRSLWVCAGTSGWMLSDVHCQLNKDGVVLGGRSGAWV